MRWQTQDADAAQLRDQLRQAARTWDEHGRSDDPLWTGSAYREFAVWRERYPGGLTETEEAFAEAMTSLATVGAVAAVWPSPLAWSILSSCWRWYHDSGAGASSRTRRAEAQKLIALGQVQLEDYPTAALAYATAEPRAGGQRGGAIPRPGSPLGGSDGLRRQRGPDRCQPRSALAGAGSCSRATS